MPGICGKSTALAGYALQHHSQLAVAACVFNHLAIVGQGAGWHHFHIAKRFPQVQRARRVVSGEMANDQMVLRVETTETAEGLAHQLGDAIREVTKLRGDVEMVPPGTLPNDGKVIEDARSYR